MYVKNKKQKKSNKKIILCVAAAIVLGLIVVFAIILIINNQKHDSNVNDQNNNTQANQNIPVQTDNSSDPKKAKQYEGEDPNTKNELTGSITSAFLTNNNLSLRVNIDQYISSGNCILTITRDNTVITQTAPIVAVASTSTCQGFDINDTRISAGAWHAKIDLLSNDNKKGVIEKEVSL